VFTKLYGFSSVLRRLASLKMLYALCNPQMRLRYGVQRTFSDVACYYKNTKSIFPRWYKAGLSAWSTLFNFINNISPVGDIPLVPRCLAEVVKVAKLLLEVMTITWAIQHNFAYTVYRVSMSINIRKFGRFLLLIKRNSCSLRNSKLKEQFLLKHLKI